MRVLIVDDNADFLRAAEVFVGRLPGVTEVSVAVSGENALEQVRTWLPDVVLMDLLMPGMDGLEATRRLKASPGGPRVLIVSLFGDSAYRAAATEAGADGFMPKSEIPVELSRFLADAAVGRHE
jgi:DNA-binding NarL/FixJ family response regulator